MLSCSLPLAVPTALAKQFGLSGACARETPCTGVTPDGKRWVYAMPSHTGTGTAAHFLMQHKVELNITSCLHSGHAVCPPAGAAVAFTWVANPFRRVLSNAAYRGAISGSRRTFNRTTAQEVSALAAYVRRLRHIDRDIISIAPHGQNMAVQIEYLRRFPSPIKIVGRTARLQEDMERLLAYLGYTAAGQGPSALSSVTFTETHCGASCASSNHAGGAGGGLFNRSWHEVRKSVDTFEKVEWYDEATAQQVVALFRADFDAFNFSTDPRRMWDVPPPPLLPFVMPPRSKSALKGGVSKGQGGQGSLTTRVHTEARVAHAGGDDLAAEVRSLTARVEALERQRSNR